MNLVATHTKKPTGFTVLRRLGTAAKLDETGIVASIAHRSLFLYPSACRVETLY